ncbi:LPS-assembly protein LptD [Maricaulis sp. W15]|uniref:LPS-assembly protein LptD n=1 Tax=Maricaulis sp. W15 TaxID=1772333 RepID=UPI000A3DCF95|nr:LPS assembly protein LptD [Maricaulis sp. W15]
MASQFRRLAAVLLSTSALALTAPALAQEAPADESPIYLEADHVEDIAGGNGYIARGNVRVRQAPRTLLADEIEYHPDENRVIARGNVIILGQGAFPQYADEVELDSQLAAGVAIGFASMLENNGRVAAAAAIRRENGSMQFDDAYYTACELCEDGDHAPTWRLRAREVVQDAEDQMIYYRDARLEIAGLPVLYAPVFAHADPSSERRSGFLFPKVGVSSRLGFVYQQPYYWTISPSQDVVIAPRLMTNVNPLIYGEYRKRFWSGFVELEGSYTNEFEIDSDGERFGESDDRWHIFGGGEWAINPDWRWGFGVQRASDNLHLRRYDFSEADKDRGAPIAAQNRQLVSQLYVDGRTRNSYGSLIAAEFQTLQTNADDDRVPTLAPVAAYEYVFTAPRGLGRVSTSVDAAVLRRDSGVDYDRASATVDWRARWVGGPGVVVEPFALARADHYSFDNLPVTNPATDPVSDSVSRTLGLAGTEISWPFYRAGESADWIVEPVVSYVYASDDPDADRIVNEDSLSIDLDESLLFQPVRAPGFDVWEAGQRVSYGLRTTAMWGEDGVARLFVGQSERLDGDAVFNASSGLLADQSDYVVAGSIELGDFDAEVYTRIAPETHDTNRLDVSINYNGTRLSGGVRYLDISDANVTRGAQRELSGSFEVAMTRHWSMIGLVQRDLDREITRRQELGIRYGDDCSQFDIVYQRENLGIQDLGPSESIQFRITLFTLGSVSPD